MINGDDSFSVYVHIPFCSRRCDYCDFATWVDKEHLIEKYIDAVINQWSYHIINESNITSKKLRSIFFGGGTPSLINPKHIVKIIETIKNNCKNNIDPNCEITVESNPDHISLEQMQTYFEGGVNRISIGVQSTNQDVLDYLGREHKASGIRSSIENILDAGLTNFSCDLIYGSGNETIDIYEKSLRDILAYKPKHISAYSLGVENKTPLAISISIGEKENVNDDDLADKYELTDRVLSENGFDWYEISNWSLPGYESKHNLSYWRGIDVIGLGCAAHGFTNENRIATPRDIERYMKRFYDTNLNNKKIQELFTIIHPVETISKKMENFALKLRTRSGVAWQKNEFSDVLKMLIENGFCQYDNEKSIIYLTLKGRLMAHSITIELYESYEMNQVL